MNKICPKCSESIGPAQHFCANCGAALGVPFAHFPIIAPHDLLALCSAWNTGIHSGMGQVNATGEIAEHMIRGLVNDLVRVARLTPRVSAAHEALAEEYIEWLDRIILTWPT